jgi:hypothetical protein
LPRALILAVDIETMPPEGWIREVWTSYKTWRKGLKNKPKKERMRAQWDKFKDAVYKKIDTVAEAEDRRAYREAVNGYLNAGLKAIEAAQRIVA